MARADSPPPALLQRIQVGQADLREVLPWLDSEQPDLQRIFFEAARRQPRWASQAVQILGPLLARSDFHEDHERQLTGLLQTFAGDERVVRRVATTLSDPASPRAARLQLLQGLARIHVDPLPDAWLDALGQVLAGKEAREVQETVYTIKAKGIRQFDTQLRQLSQNVALPMSLRVAALECLAPHERRCDPAAFRLLCEQLHEAGDPMRTMSAARALAGSRLSDNQLQELNRDLLKTAPPVVALLLPAWARSRDAKVGLALLDTLDQLPGGSCSVSELDRILAGYPAEVHQRYRPLRLAWLARNQKEWDRLASLSQQLPPGDARRGKQVFLSERARCTVCHRAAGIGGAVGPNLSRIGVIRSHADLLESIAFPDAAITPEFRAYLAATRSGMVHTGQWLQETTQAMDLRPAPGSRVRVPRQDIEELTPARASLMPRGFDQLLSLQELSDLIEFLVSLR